MEVKIKQGSEMLDATIEIVDGVMVVSPKEVKFKPKDGDVLTCGSKYEGGLSWTFILKGKIDNSHDDYNFAEEYVSLDSNGSFEISSYSDAIKWFRPATEEEKKLLFDKLEEEGWEWKTDTKEFVKLKWKPKYNEDYWCPSWLYSDGIIPFLAQWSNSKADNIYQNKGWVLRTEEECEQFCKKLNKAIEGVKP